MHSRLLSGFSESMLSAMENISLGRDSHHHYHHQQLHHGHDDQHHRQLPENEKPQLQVGVDRKKPRTITGKSDDDGEMVQMLRKKIPTPTEDQVVSPTSRICGDCRTSKTPLWRSGPDGPKSLCNACGIRYRKRRRTELDFLQVRIDENQRQVEENKTALLLLQGHKFEGKEEEAEAALLLMALSCGLCVHSS